MHKAIFVSACLLLLGCTSVVKCYSSASEEDSEMSLDTRRSPVKEEECQEETKSETKGEVHSAGASCSKCKPGQICTVPDKCTCPVGPTGSKCEIQSAGLCSSAATKHSPSVVSIDFGSGSSQYSSAKPESLGFKTDYKQVSSAKQLTHDGSFAIVNAVPHDFATWFSNKPKAHGSTDGKGYMMLVNAKHGAGQLLKVNADNLIVGLRYQFSAYFANINKKGTNIILPNLILEARTATSDRTVIASTPTGKIPEESSLTWKQYGMSFIAPTSSVILSIESKAGGGGGDDFVVDDITLVPCQPVDNVVCSGK